MRVSLRKSGSRRRRSTQRGGHGLMATSSGRTFFKEQSPQYQNMMNKYTVSLKAECNVPDGERIDALEGADEQSCNAFGGCWRPASKEGAPWCYVPKTCMKFAKTKKNSKKGGAGQWEFNVDCVNDLIGKIVTDMDRKLLPKDVDSLESDNTEISSLMLQLGGRGGSSDMCKFTLDQATGTISFEELGEPEDEDTGNEWVQTKDNIIKELMNCRQKIKSKKE